MMKENDKRLEELNMFHKTCSRELEIANNNVKIYIRKVKDMYSYLNDLIEKNENPKIVLVAYDSILTDLNKITNITRKFNISCELRNSSEDFNDIIKQYIKLKDNFTYPKPDLTKYHPNYKGECVITHIKDKDNHLFYINDLENSKYNKCNDILRDYMKKSPKKYIGIPREGEIFGLFMKGYFLRAVRENDQCDRNNPSSNTSSGSKLGNLLLIDLGEIIKFDENEMEIYSLPYECFLYPGQAILCELKMFDLDNLKIENLLSKILYMKYKFSVVSKDEYSLHISLISDTNPFLDYFLDNDDACEDINHRTALMNPFRQYYCNNEENETNNSTEVDDFLVDNSNSSSNPLQTASNLSSNPLQTASNLSSNPLQTALNLSSHPLQTALNLSQNINIFENKLLQNKTRNSLDNVQIFDMPNNYEKITNKQSQQQQNDSNLSGSYYFQQMRNALPSTSTSICDDHLKYNDKLIDQNKVKNLEGNVILNSVSTTGDRLKNFYEEILKKSTQENDNSYMQNIETESLASNFQEKCHTENKSNGINEIVTVHDLDDDGYKPIFEIRTKLINPSVGETVAIVPTEVLNVEMFFGHIECHEFRYQATLSELIRHMNLPEEVTKFSQIKRPLVKFELVIAKYNDGSWYRARVLNVYEENMVKVFFLDYGNAIILSLSEIRKWEKRFEYLPFQSVACKIFGIERKPITVIGLNCVKNLLTNKKFKARVMRKVDDHLLEVKLMDAVGNDVGNELVLLNYAYKVR